MESEFYLDGKKVYYEIYGEQGDILILLNGLMMSTASWKPFISALSGGMRLVLVDFFDQGKSARMEDQYDHSIQVRLLEGLCEELEQKYNSSSFYVAGISYGGEIALQFAIAYPARVKRLVLANAAARTSLWLKNIGDGWNCAAETGNGRNYYLTAIPVIYSTGFFEEHAQWMNNREETLVQYFSDPEVLARMVRLTKSSENFDVTERLAEVACPTLIISGSEDGLVPISEQRILHKGIKGSFHVTLNGSGHASMYECPDAFAALVRGFSGIGEEPVRI